MPPCKSFVFYNNKGGVGKTSLTFNFATEMACRLPNFKVLMIDLDGQCNLSALALGGGIMAQELVLTRMQERRDIQHYLMRQIQAHGHGPALNDPHFCACLQHVTSTWDTSNGSREEHVPPNLYLVSGASSIDLFASEVEKLAQEQPGIINPMPFRSTYNLLRDPIQKLDANWIVVADTNPSFTIISRLALVGCEELIIPTTLDELATNGVRNLLFQLGVKEIMNTATAAAAAAKSPVANNIKEYLDSKQSAEEHNARNNDHDITIARVRPARIRCLALNRVPRSGQRRANAVKRMIEILNKMMQTALVHHPDLFASPHIALPPDVSVVDRFKSCHLVEICDVKASMVVSQNLGIALGQGQQRRYKMNLPDFYELHDDSGGQATVNFDAPDQVRYALAVQDLVEMCLESDRRPQFHLVGAFKSLRCNPETSIIEVVRPRTDEVARFPVTGSVGEHGRRLLPVERNTNTFTILAEGVRQGSDIGTLALEYLQDAISVHQQQLHVAGPFSSSSVAATAASTAITAHGSTRKEPIRQRPASSAGDQSKLIKLSQLREYDEDDGNADEEDASNHDGDHAGTEDKKGKQQQQKRRRRRSSGDNEGGGDGSNNNSGNSAFKAKRKRGMTASSSSSSSSSSGALTWRFNVEKSLKLLDESG